MPNWNSVAELVRSLEDDYGHSLQRVRVVYKDTPDDAPQLQYFCATCGGLILLRPILDAGTHFSMRFQLKVAETLLRPCAPLAWVEQESECVLEMLQYLLLDAK